MLCPKCQSPDNKVLETRLSKNREIIRRRRECNDCQHRFSTQEETIRNEFIIIKSNNRREEFNIQKLRRGLDLACHKRPITEEQINLAVKQIKHQLDERFDREVPASELGTLVMEQLKLLDEVAYVRFASVYRQFKDAAEFIAEIQALYGNK